MHVPINPTTPAPINNNILSGSLHLEHEPRFLLRAKPFLHDAHKRPLKCFAQPSVEFFTEASIGKRDTNASFGAPRHDCGRKQL